jgi:hypothetical protein
MSHRLAFTVLFLFPALARADEAPERLLPASTQVYVRWDGIEAHRASYQKTALGKMMQEDTGKFLAGVYQQIQTSLGEALTVPQLLGGIDPDKLKTIQEDVSEAPKLMPLFARNGFIVGAEMSSFDPPRVQLTLILPGAAEDPKPFLSTMRLISLLDKPKGLDIKESKLGGRTVYHAKVEEAHLVWWVDGKDAVFVVGTDTPEVVVKRATAPTDRLADNAQFKKLQGFKEFETAARGFVDAPALVKLAKAHSKEVARVLDDLGLDGLQGIRFYLGFDVPADRGLIEIDMPGPRKGLLALANNKPFTLKDLPPLPVDVVSFSALRFNYGSVYDGGVKAAESIAGAVSPLGPAAVDGALKKADEALGVNIRQDLLGSLGDMFVFYNSPSDGPVNLGIVALAPVKDEKKLRQSIDQLIKGLSNVTGKSIKVHKRVYRKTELYEITVKENGFVFLPTYTIHNGWLAVSLYPQPVQAHVLRSEGELPAWKPGPELTASLDKMPKEFVAVTMSDPRPSVKTILSIAPLVGSAYRAFTQDSKFDIGALPHGEQATRHLFPNVTVVTDDGQTVRIQSRSSLQLPFDVVGIDSYFGALFFVQIARFAF